METPVETLLVVTHVSAGFTALVVAPVAMLTRKGSGVHKRWGRVYFWAMAVIFVTALALLLFRPNVFLFFISVLSFYGAFSGVRSLGRKNPAKGQGAKVLVALAAVVAVLATGQLGRRVVGGVVLATALWSGVALYQFVSVPLDEQVATISADGTKHALDSAPEPSAAAGPLAIAGVTLTAADFLVI